MNKPPRRICLCLAIFFILSIGCLGTSPVLAQSGGSATLVFPLLTNYPQVSTYLDVRDSQGNFIYNLSASQVTVVEDGKDLAVDKFEEIHSGAQFAVAMTPARSFTIRDGDGNTRYDRVLSALRDWANSQTESTNDDLSLMIANGPEASHLSDRAQWLSTLEGYQIDPQANSPNLDVLIRALEIMNDEAPRPGMGKAILFIAPPLNAQYGAGLSSLAAQASTLKIHINVWMVSTPDQVDTPEANQLKDLATQTGGQYVVVSMREPLPSLEDYLLGLRNTYHLSYRSKSISSGSHQFLIRVQAGDMSLVTEPFSFDLNIQPPNPMFVSPPEELVRQNPPNTRQPETDLIPTGQDLEVIIEFPDGMPRQVITSTLFVDGAVVARNQAAPFNQFTWDISRYLTSGTHQLRVEATDDLGMVGSSIEVPVKITVHRTPKPVWMILEDNAFLIIGSLVAIGFSLLFVGLIISGRLRPKLVLQGPVAAARRRSFWRTMQRPGQAQPANPIQKAPGDQPGIHLPGWINRRQKPSQQPASKPYASLLPLQEAEQAGLNQPILLTSDDLRIGRDASQVDYFLDDPCIDPLHTELKKEAQSYRIFDRNSTAGTWVNYELVPGEGKLLEHGDIIHIGRISFRFSQRDTAKARRVIVTPQEKEF